MCDSPLATVNELFEHLNRSKDQFDYIYWTGDLPAHNVWRQSREDQLGVIDLLTDQIKLFFKDKKVYPTLGNHESAPVNRLNCASVAYTVHKFKIAFLLFFLSSFFQFIYVMHK